MDRGDRAARDFVSLKDLAARLDVSLMTIHRDLDELEPQGVLRKVRGGATPQPSSLFESNVRYRLTQALPEKQALARAAVLLIEPGQSVLLDESTTGLALARLLPACAPLTVITNSLIVVQELRVEPRDPSHRSRRRLLAAARGVLWSGMRGGGGRAPRRPALHVDYGHLRWHRLSARSGYGYCQAGHDRRRPARRVLLVDHSKFGRVALHRLAPLSDFDLVVTDDGIDDAGLASLRDAQVRSNRGARPSVRHHSPTQRSHCRSSSAGTSSSRDASRLIRHSAGTCRPV